MKLLRFQFCVSTDSNWIDVSVVPFRWRIKLNHMGNRWYEAQLGPIIVEWNIWR